MDWRGLKGPGSGSRGRAHSSMSLAEKGGCGPARAGKPPAPTNRETHVSWKRMQSNCAAHTVFVRKLMHSILLSPPETCCGHTHHILLGERPRCSESGCGEARQQREKGSLVRDPQSPAGRFPGQACPRRAQDAARPGVLPRGEGKGVDGGSLRLSSRAGGEQAPVIRTSKPTLNTRQLTHSTVPALTEQTQGAECSRTKSSARPRLQEPRLGSRVGWEQQQSGKREDFRAHVIGWFAGEQTQSSDWLARPTEGWWQDPQQGWKSWEEEREKKRPEWEVQVSSG